MNKGRNSCIITHRTGGQQQDLSDRGNQSQSGCHGERKPVDSMLHCHPINWECTRNVLYWSSPVAVSGRLLALGGSVRCHLRRGTRLISVYSPSTDEWVEHEGAGHELPAALYRPDVVKIDKDEFMLIGGQSKPKHFLPTVCIGRIIIIMQ